MRQDPLDATCPRHIREHAYDISNDFVEDLAEREAIMSDGRKFREWKGAYALLCKRYGEHPRLGLGQ